MMSDKNFHERLKSKMDGYAHLVFRVTRKFPEEEKYGVTSQLRRAALSVALNYIEGYARGRNKVHKNFLEISYGSLKESQYLIEFSYIEGFMSRTDFDELFKLGDDIGMMLWGILRRL